MAIMSNDGVEGVGRVVIEKRRVVVIGFVV